MEIKICNTQEWTDKEWDSFVCSFEAVFQRGLASEYFKHKYCTVCDRHSYHALLLNDDGEVVGNVSIIPYYYHRDNNEVKIGLGADVFIRKEYRSDPLMLRRMYKKLTKLLIENGIVAVMAVPNATAYPYWKNVVKWKDVGAISYWAFPVKVGNILRRLKFLNLFSLAYAYLSLIVAGVCNTLVHSKQKKFSLNIVDDESFRDSRFYGDYHLVKKEDCVNFYRVVEEEGVRTAYLIYSMQNGRLTYRSLLAGVTDVLKNHKIDLILFVGPLRLFQTLFIRIPRKFEPKRLPLTCDLLTENEQLKDMLNFDNWDFGLLNYDVR